MTDELPAAAHPSPRRSHARRDRDAREEPRPVGAGDLGRLLGRSVVGGPRAAVAGHRPGDRVAVHSENRQEWLFCDIGITAARAATVGLYPTNPAPEVRPRAGRLRLAADRRRGPGAARQEPGGHRRAARCSSTWSTSSTRGIVGRYDDPAADVVGRVHRAGSPAPRGSSRRAGRPDGRGPSGRSRDPRLHLRHDRSAQGRDADDGQHRVRPRHVAGRRRVRRPAGGRQGRHRLVPAAVPRRRAGLHDLVQRRRRHAGHLRRVDRHGPAESARGAADAAVRRPPHLGEARGRRAHPDERRVAAQAGQLRGLDAGLAAGSAARWSRARAATRSATRLAYAVGWVMLYRPLRERLGLSKVRYAASGRGPDLAGGARVLHGDRPADVRGVRDDREQRDRDGQRARPGRASAPSARSSPAPSCGSTSPARS